MDRRLIDIVLATIGFILSPLSWWNDLVVNVPLAYLFSLPFSLINEHLFLPAFILGYWLTNLLGFLMLHWGGEGLFYRRRPTISLKRSLLVSVVYSVIMIILVFAGWFAPPTEYLRHLK
jgi:Sec-independent protein secretion pathway component TatC